MVLLTLTALAKEAIAECSKLQPLDEDVDFRQRLEKLSSAETGNPIEHHDLVELSRRLRIHDTNGDQNGDIAAARKWGLDSLLRGSLVYQAPPPPKPEPTPEYKALMRRLRGEEEQRQYERMINPPLSAETFGQRFPLSFNPATSHGQTGANEVDDVTYQDVERQMALIINILISIICCSVAIWIAARHWSVPQRLGLSLSGSGLVAVAEVVIYFGYIKRVEDAKVKEIKKTERKEVAETWVIERSSQLEKKPPGDDNMRYRKGKHR